MKPRFSLILALLSLGLYFRNTLISMAVFLPLLFSRVALKHPAPARAYPYTSAW